MNTTTQNPNAAPVHEKTLREQFNERMGKDMVDQIFKAITTVRRYTKFVTIVAMLVSFFHQRNFFALLGAGTFAWFLPLTLDAVTLSLMKVSSLRGIKAENRKKARRAMILPAAASMVVNGLAHGHPILRGFYVFVVVAILIGEYAESLIVVDFDEFEKEVEQRTAKVSRKRGPLSDEVKAERQAKRDETIKAKVLDGLTPAEKRRNTIAAKKAAAAAAVPAVQAPTLEIPGLDTVQALNGASHKLHVVSRHTR